jgi:hypothetical protein
MQETLLVARNYRAFARSLEMEELARPRTRPCRIYETP